MGKRVAGSVGPEVLSGLQSYAEDISLLQAFTLGVVQFLVESDRSDRRLRADLVELLRAYEEAKKEGYR